jgi:hypothetical protein
MESGNHDQESGHLLVISWFLVFNSSVIFIDWSRSRAWSSTSRVFSTANQAHSSATRVFSVRCLLTSSAKSTTSSERHISMYQQ